MTQQQLQYAYYQRMRQQQLYRAYYAAVGQKNSYKTIKRIQDDYFLNYIEYDAKDISPEKANKYFKKSEDVVVGYGMCTGVHKGQYVLRQLDWYYNNQSEFIIKVNCDGEKVKYSSIGVTATSPKLTKDLCERYINTKEYNEYFDILPYETVDGVNENGIFAQSNVVEKNDVVNIDINPVGEDCCCSIMLVRFILDRLDKLENLETLLNSLHLYGIDPKFMSYNTHILVADKEGNTRIIEFREDGFDIREDLHVMTNFRVNNGFTEVGMTHVPVWQSVEHNGQGVERWAIGNNFVYNGTDTELSSFKDLRKQLNFTNAYLSSWTPGPHLAYYDNMNVWLTDNLSGELSIGGLSVMDAFNYHFEESISSELSDRKDLFDKSMSASWIDYFNRTRETGTTWHTTHSGIYDLQNLSINLQSQQDKCWNVQFTGEITQDLT